MNTPIQPPYGTPDAAAPRNPDLAEQAVPGHGVSSQDPDPAAQVGLTHDEAEREAKSVYVGGGAMAGIFVMFGRLLHFATFAISSVAPGPSADRGRDPQRRRRRTCALVSTKSLFEVFLESHKYLAGMGCKARCAANSSAIGKRRNAADRPARHLPEGLE